MSTNEIIHSNLFKEFHTAIQQRNKKQAEQLLLKDTSIDGVECKLIHTLIHWAILKLNDTEILKTAVDQEVSLHEENDSNQTPLSLTLLQERDETVGLFLNYRAYLGEDILPLLKTAVNNNLNIIVKLFIDFGINSELFENLNDVLHIHMEVKLMNFIKMIIPYCKLKKIEKYITENTVSLGSQQYYKCLSILLLQGFKIKPGCEKNDNIVFDCIERGYSILVDELLSLGLDVNAKNKITGLTLLHTACVFRQYKVVELLLNRQADINYINEEASAWHDNFWVQRTKFVNKKTAIFIAIKGTDVKLLEILLNYGAHIPDNPEFISLVNLIVQQDHVDILEVLINYGFNVNAKMIDGRTLLHECVHCEIPLMYLYTSSFIQCNDNIKYQISQLLMKNGANVNAENPNGETPLFIAVKNNYLKMVDFFLEYNANIHHKNIDGNTPLHIISQEFWINPIIVIRLLKNKANVNEPNILGITPFHLACKNWNSNLIQLLLENGADINLKDKNGQRAIHFAAERMDNQVIKLLLKNGADMSDQDYDNRTPLHILCKNFMVTYEDLNFFLQNGADINAIDINRQTPLFYACKSGRLETVKILLSYQANINHFDIFGATPVYATAIPFPEIIEFLMKQNTINTSFVTQDGKTLLHALVKGNHVDLINEHIDKLNIHINTADNFGKTPLFYAAAELRENIVIALLQHGADINISNDKQFTVPIYIHTQMININLEITRFLDSLTNNVNEADNGLRVREEYIPHWTKMGYYMRIMQILRQDIVKLKVARMRIHPQNLRFSVYDDINIDLYVDDVYNANLRRFEFLCQSEVEALKLEKIPGTEFCLHDILIKDIHILANHISLEKIKLFLQEDYLRKTFSSYIDLINYRLSMAVRRSKLLAMTCDCAEESIFFGLPVIFTNQVFYYLNNNEIKVLNQAVQVVRYLSQSEQEEIKILLKTNSAQFLRELKPIDADSDEPIIQYTKKIKKY